MAIFPESQIVVALGDISQEIYSPAGVYDGLRHSKDRPGT